MFCPVLPGGQGGGWVRKGNCLGPTGNGSGKWCGGGAGGYPDQLTLPLPD